MNRVIIKGNWTAVPNAILRDNRLSVTARLLWALLASFSEEFVFKTDYVRDLLGVGRDTYRAAFAALEAALLARRVRSRNASGAWSWEIELFPDTSPSPEIQAMVDSPSPEIPATAQPATAQPATANTAIKEEQEKEQQEKEDLVEEEAPSGASTSASESPGVWLAEMMLSLGVRLSPIQCEAIYMQARAYFDDEGARRYLAIKSAELVAAGLPPRVLVRALAQDASDYAKTIIERSVGRNTFGSDAGKGMGHEMALGASCGSVDVVSRVGTTEKTQPNPDHLRSVLGVVVLEWLERLGYSREFAETIWLECGSPAMLIGWLEMDQPDLDLDLFKAALVSAARKGAA